MMDTEPDGAERDGRLGWGALPFSWLERPDRSTYGATARVYQHAGTWDSAPGAWPTASGYWPCICAARGRASCPRTSTHFG